MITRTVRDRLGVRALSKDTGRARLQFGICHAGSTPGSSGNSLTGPGAQETGGDPVGYDHCYVVNGAAGMFRPVAKVVDEKSGRVMEVSTTEPGVQFYSGNFLDGGKDNGGYPQYGGFCLEAQKFPNSPNTPSFPSAILKPGETYRQTTTHRFSIAK